jgi:hypothetical protein
MSENNRSISGPSSPNNYVKVFDNILSGRCCLPVSLRTRMVLWPPIYLQLSQEWVSEEVERMRIEIRDASQNLARANEELERAESAWRKQANDRLIAAQQDLVETRRAAADANTSAERENAISRNAILSLSQPDLATEYTRSNQIMEDSKNPYSRSLARLAWMLHALFVLLESLIVTMKMLTPESGMDKAVKAVEAEEQERLFIEANARISRQQMAVEATSDVYAKALAKWHVEQLEILKQGGPTTTPALLALRRECAQVVEAAA